MLPSNHFDLKDPK